MCTYQSKSGFLCMKMKIQFWPKKKVFFSKSEVFYKLNFWTRLWQTSTNQNLNAQKIFCIAEKFKKNWNKYWIVTDLIFQFNFLIHFSTEIIPEYLPILFKSFVTIFGQEFDFQKSANCDRFSTSQNWNAQKILVMNKK